MSQDGVSKENQDWLLSHRGTDVPRVSGTYFVYWPDSPYFIKVGVSDTSIEKRMKNYRSHYPREIRLLAYFDVVDVEEEYHLEYALQRIRGTEWFWLDDDIRKSLEGVISAYKAGLLSQTYVRRHEFRDNVVTDEQFPHVLRALKGKPTRYNRLAVKEFDRDAAEYWRERSGV